MSLSRDDVAKVATLARLALSEDELAQMTSELTKIVGFVSLLNKSYDLLLLMFSVLNRWRADGEGKAVVSP